MPILNDFADLTNIFGHLGAGRHRHLRRLGRPDRVRHPEVCYHHGNKSSRLCFKFTGKYIVYTLSEESIL